MSTTFSAGPQTLGYLYQVRYALYSLLNDQRGDTLLYVEDLDDLVRKNPDAQTLEQLKHHTTSAATVNAWSSDIWRTLRVWFTTFSEGRWKPEDTMLSLITTATAQEETAAAWLRNGPGRDVQRAHAELVPIAAAYGNESLKKAFDAFNNTSEADQIRILSSVFVVDNAPAIDEVEPKTKQLFNGIHPNNLDVAYEWLEGWWFDKVILHLLDAIRNESRQGISKYVVQEKLADIGYQFQPNRLPIEYEGFEPSEEQLAQGQNRLFVRQMDILKIGGRRLRNAVLDYYRAFEQRSKWTRDFLEIDDELIKYEKRLIREWDRQIGILESMLPQTSADEQVLFGVELLNWMEQKANFPIRSNMSAGHEYVMRGSFHLLADADAPRVYWHPKFVEQLEAILATPVQP
jgi:hypothetical protein